MVGQQPELEAQRPEGLVLGTEQGASTPLAFWTYVDPSRYLQLDDVVHVTSPLPDGQDVDFYGVVDELRAVQEGVRFASDVALASSGVLPAETAVSAHVSVTRIEPEIFVPPRPGEAVRRAHGAERDRALFFDAMTRRLLPTLHGPPRGDPRTPRGAAWNSLFLCRRGLPPPPQTPVSLALPFQTVTPSREVVRV